MSVHGWGKKSFVDGGKAFVLVIFLWGAFPCTKAFVWSTKPNTYSKRYHNGEQQQARENGAEAFPREKRRKNEPCKQWKLSHIWICGGEYNWHSPGAHSVTKANNKFEYVLGAQALLKSGSKLDCSSQVYVRKASGKKRESLNLSGMKGFEGYLGLE